MAYIFIFLYCLAAVLVCLNRFWQFDVFWYDFGIFDETIWKLSRFQLPYIPVLFPPNGIIVWGDHFNPSAMILAPLYWITSRSEIILVAQVVFVGISSLIAYRLARKFFSKLLCLALIICYLGFVGMQNALITDAHNIVFSLPFLMACFWAIYNEKWKIFWLSLFVFLSWQENLAAVGVGIGLFLMLRQPRKVRIGLLVTSLSIIYGILVMKVVIPYFSGHRYSYEPNFSGTLSDLFSPDIKLRTIFYSLASFGFLPIFSIATWPLILEHFFERFVLNTTVSRWSLGLHYSSLLSPILFLATVEILRKLGKFKRLFSTLALFLVILTLVLHRFVLRGPLALAYNPDFYRHTGENEFIKSFVEKIPREGFLMTQNNIASHFTHQKVVLLSLNYDQLNPDVIAVDLHPGQNLNNFYFLREDETQSLVASLLAEDSKYKNIVTDNYRYIFVKK